MKRIFLLLSFTFILGMGLSSCNDEAAEITPETQISNERLDSEGGGTVKEKAKWPE